MKSVLISIQPKWVEKIASGQKTIEVRKSRPKIETPFKCYIYETIERVKEIVEEYDSNFKLLRRKRITKQWGGKVIGEFTCDRIDKYTLAYGFSEKENQDGRYGKIKDYAYFEHNLFLDKMCLTEEEFYNYGKGKPLFGWHISDLKIYDKPRELGEFYTRCNIPENKCKLCDNCFDREDYYGRHYAVKKLTRPPQSWQFIEV